MRYNINFKSVSGIYIIKNSINNKVYVGSAINLYKRYIGHKNQFTRQKHNERFQNFVNKYGIETLNFCLLEYCKKNKLIEREQFWIDFYKSYKSNKGFNVCPNAGSNYGAKMPETQKIACHKRMLGNKIMQGFKHSNKTLDKISINSKIMWMKNREKMLQVCTNIALKRKGIPQWLDKPHPMLGKQHPAKKPIALIDKMGNVLEIFPSAKEAAEKFSLYVDAINRVCNGKYKHTKGHKFKWMPSSKLCECGELNNNLTLADREWTCEKCGAINERDKLAARNIKKFGLQKQNLIVRVGVTPSAC